MSKPTILAIMQNQWFNDPQKVRAMIERDKTGKLRRRMIEYALFAGCKSGQVLRRVFGNLCEEMIWEEASPEIGGHSSSSFPANIPHLVRVIEEIRPHIIIGFGRIAEDGLTQVMRDAVYGKRWIFTTHPTARGDDTIKKLIEAKGYLDRYISEHQPQIDHKPA